jgi:hypothetical protein
MGAAMVFPADFRESVVLGLAHKKIPCLKVGIIWRGGIEDCDIINQLECNDVVDYFIPVDVISMGISDVTGWLWRRSPRATPPTDRRVSQRIVAQATTRSPIKRPFQNQIRIIR